MPRSKPSSGFQPIQYTPGAQNRPPVPEVDFSTPALREPVKKAQAVPSLTKPQTAAQTKED